MSAVASAQTCARDLRDVTRTMADDAGRLNQVFAETSFLYGSNASFIEDLHEKWAADPASVSVEWRAFFDSLNESASSVKASVETTPWARPTAIVRDDQLSALDGLWPAVEAKAAAGVKATQPGASEDQVHAAARDSVRALMLIRTYRIRGHLHAKLDPLGIEMPVG